MTLFRTRTARALPTAPLAVTALFWDAVVPAKAARWWAACLSHFIPPRTPVLISAQRKADADVTAWRLKARFHHALVINYDIAAVRVPLNHPHKRAITAPRELLPRQSLVDLYA
jgi:hypothetical protein